MMEENGNNPLYEGPALSQGFISENCSWTWSLVFTEPGRELSPLRLCSHCTSALLSLPQIVISMPVSSITISVKSFLTFHHIPPFLCFHIFSSIEFSYGSHKLFSNITLLVIIFPCILVTFKHYYFCLAYIINLEKNVNQQIDTDFLGM